jgi:hypothetical protein
MPPSMRNSGGAVDQSEEFKGSPPAADDEAYRQVLRAVLASQIGFEGAQHLRQQLLFVLAPASAVVWVLAAWPGVLPLSLRSTLLGVWWLLLAGVLYAWVVELLWLRRSNAARRDLRAMAPPTTGKRRAAEGDEERD